MTGPDRPRGQVRPRRVRASDPVARPVHGDGTATFEAHRPRLLRIAYRMLGSRSEAEDVVQDAWLRWVAADRTGVAAPDRFLARVVTRLCLDQIKSARARRESYVGPWLPEPLVEAAADGVDEDDLTLTLMLALERLSPLERAAFLLHDVFGLPLGDVAETLGRAPPAVRQLAARARRNVRAARPRYPVTRDEGERVARAFFEASASGDVARLRTLLADRVTLSSDGGGKVLAFVNPIRGLERLLRLYAGVRRKWGDDRAALVAFVWIDGLPGYVSRERGGLLQTTALAIENGRIDAIYVTRNPDKLRHVARAVAAGPTRGGAAATGAGPS
ncbi:RNA polymerase sigma factor (sigma-70 family) [Methylobacterium sp. PvP062]|jgi:RNA polymerase sigma factor (sigma-70 family)|uniref:RNA polymerase sigma-70 factor (ECF subfamily) n=1 Tax=Methylobacterium radiotolerans TaxID=31998 RepID=A0ABV2NPS3_9HYPH|nr:MULTISPECIES: sigma-70 family RNA polymerase sigma factor [Methylobacterium]MCX7334720.1 sigma-70 family RNA polymerase sigma factor [Hyphomicrobiales bacterium]GAN48646.1 RNA polymerase sigma factor [Methylobacterium sp. ME121]MBP2494771.1 RNA polymerase sigma-70 factor (ECF subfamily) [Methylobacterium sp. PvP105]MBP2505358.1 RNA polymerase sigma-70 factor (ECF subfamily) [Methylobacterium sp. PvP109]OXE41249.1 RNA polymerase sigma factor SigJ [Methylobacterium radiotolerans]